MTWKKNYSSGKSAAERVEEITKKLEEGIRDIYTSGKFADYLSFMSKFPHYSVNNQILIFCQKPDSSLVCGYRKWQDEFGRNVKKGEKALRILGPRIKKEIDPDTGREEQRIVGFMPLSVFDVSQTEGKELPSLAHRLTADISGFEEMRDAIIKAAPVPVYIEDIPYRDSTNGYFSPTEGKIVVRAGLSEAHTLKTLIHETAHSRLHWDREHDKLKKIPTTQAEIEAESVAYTVCSYYGIDSSDYSFGYVAGWSQKMDTSELMASMNTIQTAAQEIIKTIDAELIRTQEKEACTSLIVIPDQVTEQDFGKSGIEAAIERVEKGPVIGPEERSIGR